MNQKEIPIPIEISARHIHLCQEDIDVLFGKNYKLKKWKKLSQGEDFAAEETVDIEANEEVIKNIRVVGMPRQQTQSELTFSDAYKLKMDIPVRLSGDIKKTPGFKIIGPAGAAVKKEGMIIAQRHLHASPEDAKKYGLKSGDSVSVTCGNFRKTTFYDFSVRVQADFKLSAHIDVDEANACGIKTCGIGRLIV